MPVTHSGTIDRAALPRPRFSVQGTSSAPTSSIERQLLQVWQSVLDEKTVGIDDCFFEMGGTSFDAMRLCLLVEKTTGVFVPVSMLLSASSVRRFSAALLESGQQIEFNPAVLLAGWGSRAPIYFIAGDGGHPLELRALAANLMVDRPIYGLQLPGLDGVSQRQDSVQAAAQLLLPTIRELSGTRPIHLLGYCYGGLVAFEIACALRASGVDVGRLLLVEAYTAESITPKPFFERLMIHLKCTVPLGPTHFLRRLCARIQRGYIAFFPPPDGKLDGLIARMQAMNLAAFYRYQPGHYSGDVVSIRAAADYLKPFMSDTTGGWTNAVGGKFLTDESPGDHITMLRSPHVVTLARLVEQHLAECD